MENMESKVSEFHIAEYDGKRPIIIYGAGVFGEYTLRALQSHDIEPVFFCDRNKSWGGEYLGKKVYEYTAIGQVTDPIILLAVGEAFAEVWHFLEGEKISEVYSVYELIFQDSILPMNRLSLQAKDIVYYEQVYLLGKEQLYNPKLSILDYMVLSITERCSLRCKGCSDLMQYFVHPENFDVEKVIAGMEKLLTFVDAIMDVRLIGGEPFMHPQMADILQWLINNPKLRNISIYTNASILPDERELSLLKNKKVKCEISDYGTLVKNFPAFIELMEKEQVRHHILKHEYWHDLGKLEYRGRTVPEMKGVYESCYSKCIMVIEDKIYRCPYSAHGRRLGAIPYVEEDVVDLSSDDDIREKLRKLIYEKEYDTACGYCSGRNPHLGTTEVAVQIKEPLPYEKCE